MKETQNTRGGWVICWRSRSGRGSLIGHIEEVRVISMLMRTLCPLPTNLELVLPRRPHHIFKRSTTADEGLWWSILARWQMQDGVRIRVLFNPTRLMSVVVRVRNSEPYCLLLPSNTHKEAKVVLGSAKEGQLIIAHRNDMFLAVVANWPASGWPDEN